MRLTGGSTLRVLGTAESGVSGGRYRDAIVLSRAGDEVLVVNDVGLERYLYVELTDAEAERRLAPVLAGDLVDVAVVARTTSGRAATVRITGTLGTREVPGTTARSLLGLRSSWFTVEREAG